MQSDKELYFKKQQARSQVKKIRGFYIHLMAFCLVFLLVGLFWVFGYRICFVCFNEEGFAMNILGFFPWLLVLLLQGAIVFRKLPFFNRWEERKIREFMEE